MHDKQLKKWATSCLRKRRYPNEQVANEMINRIKKYRKNTFLRSYFCSICNGWHLTHKEI